MIHFPTTNGGISELFDEPNRLRLLGQAAHIVVIDDEQVNVDLLAAIVTKAGYQTVTPLTDGRRLASLVAESPPDLVITDLHMPGFDGLQVIRLLSPLIVSERLPVLVVTGDGSADARYQALSQGARDFVTKPFHVTEVTLRVRNLLETRLLYQDLRKQNRALLEASRGQARELESTRVEMIERLAIAAEYRDDSTSRHNQRVGAWAARIAERIGQAAADVALLSRAAALHDIGKIGIPDALLHKSGRLTPGEVRVMQTHTTIGARILGGSDTPLLRLAEVVALSHHERWDGSGYPGRLAGDAIPLPGRIVAVADTFDAMTSDRPYRSALSVADALDQLRAGRDTLFEAGLVDTLEACLAAAAPTGIAECVLA